MQGVHTQTCSSERVKANDKEEISKGVRENGLFTYKGTSVRLTDDFSSETMKDRRYCDDIFKELKENNCQLRILNSAKKVK